MNNFYIVGAPKAGTTSIYYYLRQHPSVYLPSLKELHFFSYPEVTTTYYNVPFITNKEEYDSFFIDIGSKKVCGDISPSYLFYEKTPQRIKNFDKNAKIIIILRNPIERAISHYLMDIRIGYQREEMLDILNKPEDFKSYYEQYVEVGMYSEQVKRYQSVFKKENILILEFNDLKNNLESSMKKICNFIEIDDTFIFDFNTKHNTFMQPKNQNLIYFLKQNSFSKNIIKFIPYQLKNYLKKFLYSKTANKPDFKNVKEKLHTLFSKDIVKLNQYIDVDTNKWLVKK